MAVWVLVVQHLTISVKDPQPYRWGWQGLLAYVGGYTQFDSWEYLRIAEDGYWYRPGARSPVVFFPLYPMVVRVAHVLIDQWVVAAVAVSAVAGLAAVLLFWRWTGERGLDATARATAVAVLLLYPYGWYLYGIAYADALFLALALGAFLLGSRDRLVWAAVVGALATATRPTGVAIVPGLVVLALERAGVLTVPPDATGVVARFQLPIRVDRDRFRPVLLAPLGALAGIAAYAAYLGARFGEPLVFLTDQSQYQGSGLTTLLKAGFVARMFDWSDPTYSASTMLQGALVVAVFCSVPAVARRFGWGHGAFVLSLVAILTLVSRDYLGAGRYLLAAFPVAALVGEWLSVRPRLRAAWLAAGFVLLTLGTIGYSQSRMLT